MATNLFAPLSEQTKKDVLVEFRAGRMNKEANSRMVRPDKRKGLVQLKLNPVENLIHFIWKDRTTGQVDLDLMLFPDDAVFRKVQESKSRVYVLEFKTSDKKLFFWMQEPKDDKDAQNCENINKYIANPPQAGQSGGGAGAGPFGLDIGGMDQNQILQMLRNAPGGLGLPRGAAAAAARLAGDSSASSSSGSSSSSPAPRPAPTPSAAPASTAAASTVNRQTLESLLADFAQQAQQPRGPSLTDVIDVDQIVASGLFDNPAVVAKLAEYLPEGPVTAGNLKENIRSPQFKQAVSMFNQALRSGQLASIMSSFGLDASTIGPNSTIEDFLLAIQKKAKEEAKKEEKPDDKMDTSQ